MADHHDELDAAEEHLDDELEHEIAEHEGDEHDDEHGHDAQETDPDGAFDESNRGVVGLGTEVGMARMLQVEEKKRAAKRGRGGKKTPKSKKTDPKDMSKFGRAWRATTQNRVSSALLTSQTIKIGAPAHAYAWLSGNGNVWFPIISTVLAYPTLKLAGAIGHKVGSLLGHGGNFTGGDSLRHIKTTPRYEGAAVATAATLLILGGAHYDSMYKAVETSAVGIWDGGAWVVDKADGLLQNVYGSDAESNDNVVGDESAMTFPMEDMPGYEGWGDNVVSLSLSFNDDPAETTPTSDFVFENGTVRKVPAQKFTI